MCLVRIVFAVFAWTTVTNHVFVSGQIEGDADKPVLPPVSEEEKPEAPPVENHTFVALIDIAFVDGSKRQCTGTIIHDNVVVTAAHCFLIHGPGSVDIELSGSFVVIGTKKMFDTGYENYLPIERILTHPKYKGWTADLALVFTFAGMITDKPGYALPLLDETDSTPVDSNVTILSWGRCPEDAEKPPPKWKGEKKRQCAATEEENESCEAPPTRAPLRSRLHISEQHSEGDNSDSIVDFTRATTVHNSHRALASVLEQKLSQDDSPDKPKQSNDTPEPYEHPEPTPLNVIIEPDNHTISIESSHVVVVTAEPEVKKKENLTKALRRHRKRYQKASRNMPVVNVKKKEKLTKTLRRHRKHSHQKASRNKPIVNVKEQVLEARRSGRNASLDGKTTISYYKNLRRKGKPEDPKENTLTVETFGFVNVQTCKKLVDKVMPSHGINTNEIVCYAADEHYISDDDSGAPAVRQGHLVAVTVGGVECEGDHVAVGMKMNCFCSWIAENLPVTQNSVDWKCCKDCCNGDEPKKTRKYKHKN